MSDAKHLSYRRICGLSEQDGGFIHRRRLIGLGIPRTTIDSWRRNGRLTSVWPAVYATGSTPTEPQARAHGALLAAGPSAALAGWSAGAYYGVTRNWEPWELISTDRSRTAGLTVHLCRTLAGRDVWHFGRLRVTSPARTALDLAAKPRIRQNQKRLHRIVDRLRLEHHLNLHQLRDVVQRNPRHPGAAPLRKLLRILSRRATRSDLERRWPAIAARFGLTPYEQNAVVAGDEEADVLIDGLVDVELDTVETHMLNFESDRHRDAKILAATAIPTIRLLDTDIDGDMTEPARQIRAAVERRRRETAQDAAA